MVAGRRETEGKATLEVIRSAGGEGMFVKTDVSKAADVKALVEKTVKAFGGLDYAFNNAGIEGQLDSYRRAERRRTGTEAIDINLKGTWLCLKFELQQMLKQGRGGAIVNNSSIAGFIGSYGTSDLCRQQTWRHGTDQGGSARGRKNRNQSQRGLSSGDRDSDGRSFVWQA